MRLGLLLALLFAPALLQAQAPTGMIAIKAGQPVTIRTDRAYILFRTIRPEDVHSYEPVFLRVPRPDELELYHAARRAAFERARPDLIRRRERQIQANAERVAAGKVAEEVGPEPSLETFNFVYDDIVNVQRVNAANALVPGRPESVYLVEAIPGDYILYGVSYEAGPANLHTCMCLGTVGFSAPAGAVTDLGYFLADSVHRISKVPELRAESGFGQTMAGGAILVGATVRPVRSESPVPSALGGATVRPAEYRAIGKFVERRTAGINRLAPVPGVLDYQEGRVIDVKSGRAVPDVN